ncbi:hypothetical protein DSO57_1022318 [Entomophthora muscae]|uniref:Uncharacterized protein n=1 Tax=Entomophthora muscae TaxID=34485 RepID=A0ACC2SFU7_9FUNG|nr:hypothetical protein DSO57_1022318 [Entomophthora muscae]
MDFGNLQRPIQARLYRETDLMEPPAAWPRPQLKGLPPRTPTSSTTPKPTKILVKDEL